jgi:prepilin peptidase CpaA
MDFNDSFELSKVLLLGVLLLLCSASDLSTRRIPNSVLLSTLMTALFLNSVGGGLAGLADSIAGLALGILMLMPLHVLGRMGAGDVKLLGVVGSVIGAWGAIVAGLATMMAGAVLGVLYMVWLLIRPKIVSWSSSLMHRVSGTATGPHPARTLQTVRTAEIPYAVAIAAGTVAALIYLDLLIGVSIT